MDVKDFVKTHNFTNGTTTAIIFMVVKDKLYDGKLY